MSGEKVFIYALGGDMQLREACGELLAREVVSHVGLIDASEMYLKKDNPKVSCVGRATVIVVERARVDEVFERLRHHVGESLRAWAMPVLAAC